MTIPETPADINTSYIEYLTWMEDGKFVHGPGSNFFIEPDGTHVEGEYQANKIANPFIRRIAEEDWSRILPGRVKKLGRKVDPLRKDWEKIKVQIMTDLVRKKFTEHEELRAWLLGTKNALIVEGNSWHDNFWGNCRCQKCKGKRGDNMLGKILMQVRDELKKTTDASRSKAS